MADKLDWGPEPDEFDDDQLEGFDYDEDSYEEDGEFPGAGSDPNADTHRGAFGEFGATVESGFLDREFREKIIVVGLTMAGGNEMATAASLDELELLIDTAGADVVERFTQKRDRPDAATYVGKGKVTEILEAALFHDCDTVVFDDVLTPAQGFTLEKLLKRSALDRTAVILDIFAQHATSAEGKAQVELAQLRYRLPRLRGKKDFSQQGGGIGTRGPGETQLEVDRRRLVRRIHKLERDLRGIADRRSNQRKARRSAANKTVSIVGYTNAGKSTLLNRITGAGVKAEDQLFATVDPTTRKTQLPGGEMIMLTDTVGFVRKLPHQLVEAFKSTLEVAAEADLLVHVVDGAGPDPMGQMAAVREVLAEIGADEVPELIVFNKTDLASDMEWLLRGNEGSVAVSAKTGEGMEGFFDALSHALRATTSVYELFVPWARGDALASAHREGEVILEVTEDEGMRIRARLEPASASRLTEFIVSKLD